METPRWKSLLATIGKILTFALLLPIYAIGIPLIAIFYAYARGLELLFSFTSHGKAAFFPPDIYPWRSTLEGNWPKIRSELDGLLTNLEELPNYQDLAPSLITDDDKWKAVVFNVMGRRVEENARVCPETAKLLESIPGLVYAMFSLLKPNKHLPAHRSAYGGVLNCHFAVRVPKRREQCGIRVAGETRHYEEGQMLVFNDRLEHEAWNHSDELRVVLLMYVARPLPFPLSAMNRVVIWASQFLRLAELSQIRKVASEAGRKIVRART